MKNILVLTDFSENSVNAYRYAVQLACAVKANLMLVFSSNGAPISLTNQQQYSQKLHSFAKRYACDNRQINNPHHTECRISSDKWPEAVNKLVSVHQPDLLIAGSGMLPEFIKEKDSFLLSDFEHCPILWIPDKANFQSLKHLVFATDFTDQEPAVVEHLKNLASLFNAQVSAVHFYPEADRSRLAELKKGGEDLDWALGGVHSKYFLVEEEDMIEGFHDFTEGVEHFPVDLFILATQDSHLAQQYLRDTYRKTLANHTAIPLLNIYQQKKKACSGSCHYCQKADKSIAHKVAV